MILMNLRRLRQSRNPLKAPEQAADNRGARSLRDIVWALRRGEAQPDAPGVPLPRRPVALPGRSISRRELAARCTHASAGAPRYGAVRGRATAGHGLAQGGGGPGGGRGGARVLAETGVRGRQHSAGHLSQRNGGHQLVCRGRSPFRSPQDYAAQHGAPMAAAPPMM